MNWTLFWAAFAVVVALAAPFISSELERRKGKSAAREFTSEGAEWVLEQGHTYQDLLRLLLSLDRAALVGLSDASSGNEYVKARVFERSADTWALVVFRDELIVGYWSFFSLSDRLVRRLREGLMFDSEITEEEIHTMNEPGSHNLYIEMFGVHLSFKRNKNRIFRMLLSSLNECTDELQRRGVAVKAVYATGFSEHGAALCKAFGLHPIAKSAQGGEVYCTTDINMPLRRLELLSKRRRNPI